MTTNDDNPAMSTNVHDPLCPRPLCDYGQPDGDCTGYEDCAHDCRCALIARVRADERERCGREAQEAVAIMPLNSFPDGGAQAALVWRDGWQTGWDAATNHATREGDTQ